MIRNKFLKHSDFCSIVENEIPESITLEYKDADILKNPNKITKAVSALANSVGGHFLIGIKSKDNVPIDANCGWQEKSKYDWLYQIINSNIFPNIDGVDIHEINDTVGKLYYSIYVPRSPMAPHQNSDNLYYKRKGSHSISMEHYEIEDIRNRPKLPNNPLSIEIHKDQGIAFVKISNLHQESEIRNLKIEIVSNFEIPKPYIYKVAERGLRIVKPREDKIYLIDSIQEIFRLNSDAYLRLNTTYEFQSALHHRSEEFFFQDFSDNVILENRGLKAVEKISEKIKELNSSVSSIADAIEEMNYRISDGTGIRMSARPKLSAEKGGKHSPQEFNSDGYRILLDMKANEADKLDQIFHKLWGIPGNRDRYDKLPDAVKEKFESIFVWDWPQE